MTPHAQTDRHTPNRRVTGRRARRSAALLVVGAFALAACGGDAEPVADPDEPAPERPVDTRPPVDGPESTLSPDVPDDYEGQIGPVDVIGDPLPPLVDGAADTAIGQQAPVLVGLDPEGRPIRIDPANDGPTMLVFLAHWCPACNEEIPKLNRMRNFAQFPEGLNVVGISTAVGPDRPNWPPVEWLREDREWRMPAMLDGIDTEREAFIAADAYGLTAFPFVVMVDADGVVVDRWSGGREAEEILARIEAAVA